MRRYVLIGLLGLFIIALDLLWGGQWTIWRYGVNPSLLVVIALTLTIGIVPGIIAALIAGMLFGLSSITGSTAHIIGFMGAASITWFVSRRIVTSRSAVSFISSIAAGTAAYTLLALGSDYLASLAGQPYHLALLPMGIAMVVQVGIHPVLLSIAWRTLGRDRYHRVASTITHSF